MRVIVLDTALGCVQSCQDLHCDEMGVGVSPGATCVQAIGLTSGGQLALALNSVVVLLHLPLRPPTLANLVGALALCSSSAATATATAPCAAAAARALHPDALAALGPPMGDGPRLVVPAFTPLEAQAPLAAAAAGPGAPAGGGLFAGRTASGAPPPRPLLEAEAAWAEVGAERLDEAEAGAGAVLADAGHPSLASEQAFRAHLRPLLDLASKQGAVLSPRLVSRLLAAAAERGWWAAARTLLDASHPGSLAACPGVAAAAAAAHQFQLLHRLLVGASDLGVDELASVLRTLLAIGRDKRSAAAAQRYRAAGRQEAERLVAAAEAAAAREAARRRGRQGQDADNEADGGGGKGTAAAGGGQVDDLAPPELEQALALASCAAAALDGLSAPQFCLHPLLAGGHDLGVLLAALRQLSAAQALALLRYLAVLLRNLAGVAGNRLGVAGGLPREALVLPHPLAALAWAGTCLDACMPALVLRPEAAPVLAELRTLVGGQLGELRRLAQLHGALAHLCIGAALPRPRGAAVQYSIEWLDLRVVD